jgi:hypothetical protein
VSNAEPQEEHPDNRLTFLKAEVDRRIEDYHNRRRGDRRKAFRNQMATVALSAAITVLLGLRPAEPLRQRFADVALVFGALITVISAAEAFFRHRNIWLIWSFTAHRLEKLRRHLEWYQIGLAGRQPENRRLDSFLDEFDRILWDDQQAWLRLREVSPGAGVVTRETAPAAVESRTVGERSKAASLSEAE